MKKLVVPILVVLGLCAVSAQGGFWDKVTKPIRDLTKKVTKKKAPKKKPFDRKAASPQKTTNQSKTTGKQAQDSFGFR